MIIPHKKKPHVKQYSQQNLNNDEMRTVQPRIFKMIPSTVTNILSGKVNE